MFDPTLQANLYQAFFDAWRQSGDASSQGVYFWNWDPNAAEVGPGNGANFSPQGLAAQSVVQTEFAACFAAGTHISTPSGPVAVELLRVGDHVIIGNGEARSIKWLGYRHMDCTKHSRPIDVLPIRVRAHAFGSGRPSRDLFLSPDYAVYVRHVLIPIRYLINGRSITQHRQSEITYWHVETGTARHPVC